MPQLKSNKDLTVAVKDHTGEIGCLRFNHLYPPFDNPAIRRVVVAAIDQKELMEAVAGAAPEPDQDRCRHVRARHADGERLSASRSCAARRTCDKLKKDLIDAGYKGEKIVVLAASTIPTIYAEARGRRPTC